jgi:hypothetical protein
MQHLPFTEWTSPDADRDFHLDKQFPVRIHFPVTGSEYRDDRNDTDVTRTADTCSQRDISPLQPPAIDRRRRSRLTRTPTTAGAVRQLSQTAFSGPRTLHQNVPLTEVQYAPTTPQLSATYNNSARLGCAKTPESRKVKPGRLETT